MFQKQVKILWNKVGNYDNIKLSNENYNNICKKTGGWNFLSDDELKQSRDIMKRIDITDVAISKVPYI